MSSKKQAQHHREIILKIEGHDLGTLTPGDYKKETFKKLIQIAFDQYLLTQKVKPNAKNI
jgi:hypothetical protein